ncbi:Borealin-like N-terminal [Penicillium paradoxum]|uniref:Borealin-like N-terminal n=1 Tax=Penicillium paradoxum TaxID=176176 RepID=UPI002548FF7D|nr:Borealin-like N-terminal [Penicillium paradoxum]KAJ5781345.1 Borealin-like N-terminal [Penicillium paradoxum]
MPAIKRKSDAMDATPTGSPTKKMRLTQNQKQALIDNLQLEITERARKLRAQYALQANDLRARIERRVNRIPVSLRKANIGELLEKHNAAMNKQLTASPSRKYSPAKTSRNIAGISVDPETRTRGASHDPHFSDKENAPAGGEPEGIKNPKRRVKPAAPGGASRVVSQEVRGNENRILSPKSNNSRTYPQSPFRASPEKGQPTYLSRPTSPLKPSSPLRSRGATVSSVKDQRPPSQLQRTANRSATGPKTTRSPLSRPGTRQGERKNSTGSTASSGTTVTKSARTGTGARKATTAPAAAAARKPAPRMQVASVAVKKSATNAAMRKATAPTAAETTTRTRALRKRI